MFCKGYFSDQFFIFLKLLFFGLLLLLCDLVQDVKAIFPLPELPTATGNLFLKYE